VVDTTEVTVIFSNFLHFNVLILANDT
jgi:hypothetical protein